METVGNKLPLVKELTDVRETGNNLNWHIFCMQVEEMNKKKMNESRVVIETWLTNFNEMLSKLELFDEVSFQEMTFKEFGINIPLCLKSYCVKNFKFIFSKPKEKAFIIGSTAIGCCIDKNLNVDVCVLMPLHCFQKYDYLNLNYDIKRACYLTYISAKIAQYNKLKNDILSFNYYMNNPLKPFLEVNTDGIYQKITFRILISAEQDSFPLEYFTPWSSNIRKSLFAKLPKCEDNINYATQNYNSAVLMDLTMRQNNNLINEILAPCRNIKSSLILLKIWLKQSNMEVGFGGFGSHILTMFVVYLLKKSILNNSMNSYQIACSVWYYLSSSAWNEKGKGISLCESFNPLIQPTLEQFHTSFEIVFIDSTGFLNICANLSLDIYRKIKYESNRILELLTNKKIDVSQIFFSYMPKSCKFDHILKIVNDAEITRILKEHEKKPELYNYAGYWYPQANQIITNILRKGLKKRIHFILPLENQTESWIIWKKPQKYLKSLTYGIIFNSDYAYEVIDKGPIASDAFAQEFRNFWGSKSELRRFQDGSIMESCLWCSANAPASEKRVIIENIIDYLLEYHLKIKKTSIVHFNSDINTLCKLDKYYNNIADMENASLHVIKTFDKIDKKLRSIDNLPIDINPIYGISSVFRYTNPMLIYGCSKLLRVENKETFNTYSPFEGVVQLGLYGNWWPDNLSAFRRVKTSLYIHMSKYLRLQQKLQAKANPNGLYVMVCGFVFRLEISNLKEVHLLKTGRLINGKLRNNLHTTESLDLEKRIVILPKITKIIHGLHQRYSSYASTVIFVKRWLYSQMIDRYLFPEECVEFLVAWQFLKGSLLNIPEKTITGFFRFLHLMASTNWKTEIIVLNFNNEMTYEEISSIEKEFNSNRHLFPPLCIITSCDTKRNGLWSSNNPSQNILTRVSVLAKHALNFVDSSLASVQPLCIEKLFQPSLEGYDILIHLRRVINLQNNSSAGFDPISSCLQELREAYNDFAIFFYNPYGGRIIAVLWKPGIFNEKDFDINGIRGCHIKNTVTVSCKLENFVDDFKIITESIYTKIVNISDNIK